MKFYTYTLSDPRTGSIRYVGMTKNPKARLCNHISIRTESNEKKRKWITSLKALGIKPSMTIIKEFYTADECANHEKQLIAYYRGIGCEIVNASGGGESGPYISEEARKCREEKMIFERDLSILEKHFPIKNFDVIYSDILAPMLRVYGPTRSNMSLNCFKKLDSKARCEFCRLHAKELTSSAIRFLGVRFWYYEI